MDRSLGHKLRLRSTLSFFVLTLITVCLAALATGSAAQEESDDTTVIVAEAQLCLEIEEHQPVSPGDSFDADVEQIVCWSKIVNGDGESIVHAWIHEGTTRAQVELDIGSDSWRTYSTKRILPSWTGSWEVKIMTPDGVVLKSIPFTVN